MLLRMEISAASMRVVRITFTQRNGLLPFMSPKRQKLLCIKELEITNIIFCNYSGIVVHLNTVRINTVRIIKKSSCGQRSKR